MGRFATGVTVITTVTADGRPAGMTVSAFASVSLDPPLVLVCIGTERFMCGALRESPGYVVNVLGREQAPLAMAFARRAQDRFAGVAWRPGLYGMPLLGGAITTVQCEHHAVTDGGDHEIFVGRVRRADVRDGEPLLYADGAFLQVAEPAWRDAEGRAVHDALLALPW